MNNFGLNLARLRLERGMSQRELAKELNTTQSYISDLEVGRTNPSWKFAHLAAEFFGVSIGDMAAASQPVYA
jgi:transcriptional regulator with XRE-family HTH domain